MSAPGSDWQLNADGSYTLLGLRRGWDVLVTAERSDHWRAAIYLPAAGGVHSRFPSISKTFWSAKAAQAWACARVDQLDGFEPAPGSCSGATGVATPDPGR